MSNTTPNLAGMLRVRTEEAALEFRDMKNRLAVVGANLRHLDPENKLAVDADRIGALVCSLERRAWETLEKA